MPTERQEEWPGADTRNSVSRCRMSGPKADHSACSARVSPLCVSVSSGSIIPPPACVVWKVSGERRWLSLGFVCYEHFTRNRGEPSWKWGLPSDAWLCGCWVDGQGIPSSVKGLQILPLLNPDKNGKAEREEKCQTTWGEPEVNPPKKKITLKGISASSLYILSSGDKQFHDLLLTR